MSGRHAEPSRIKVWPMLTAKVTPYSKAIAGAVAAAVLMWLKVRGHGIDGDEWAQIIGAAAAGSGLVYAVPNKDPKAQHQSESVQPPGERVRRRNEAAGRS